MPCLPDSVAVLQGMVVECHSTIERLKHEVLLLRRWRFGRKPEKPEASGQLSLFHGVLAGDAETQAPVAKPVRKDHGKKLILDNLPVKRMKIDVPADEFVCQPCGSGKIRIGEETRRELDYIPGSIFVREYVRPIYACPWECEDQMAVAANPSSPIEKGLPGPGLLAHVATSKYADHFPLNRQEGILSRQGVAIHRSTMADWMAISLLSFTRKWKDGAAFQGDSYRRYTCDGTRNAGGYRYRTSLLNSRFASL